MIWASRGPLVGPWSALANCRYFIWPRRLRASSTFLPAGAEAYRRDLPKAAVHLLDTGHFALEDKFDEIEPLIHDFLDRKLPHS